MTRTRHHDTAFARRLRRLRMTLEDAQRWTREPIGTLKNYKQGRRRTPRAALRMLAAYRLTHWGRF